MSFFQQHQSDASSNLTEKLALYMTDSLSTRFGASISVPTNDLSYDLLKDCEMILAQVYQAHMNPSKYHTFAPRYMLIISNQVYIPWSIEEYSEALTKSQNISTVSQEHKIMTRFPPLFSNEATGFYPLQDEPCTVVDSNGIIVLWYLPDS